MVRAGRASHEAAAGTVLNGGLGGLLSSANKQISEGERASALGIDTLDTLSNQTGMGREDLLSGLRQHFPRFVDQLTPDGRLPSNDDLSVNEYTP